MFTLDTLINHNAATTKQAFAYIPNQEVRTGFESLVDAQAEYAKTVFAVASDLGKNCYDAAIAAFPKQATVAKK